MARIVSHVVSGVADRFVETFARRVVVIRLVIARIPVFVVGVYLWIVGLGRGVADERLCGSIDTSDISLPFATDAQAWGPRMMCSLRITS